MTKITRPSPLAISFNRKTNADRTRDYLVSYIHGGNFKMVFYFVELLVP